MTLTFGLAIFAILIGISVGITLQRGRACTNTAFRNFLLFKNNELITFVIIAVSVQIIGYYFLYTLSIPNFEFIANPISFSYIFIPLGGFIFGLGTVVAGGCAGGICYRVGEGSGASLLGFFGFATGIVIIASSPLTDPIDNFRGDTNLQINNETPSLTHIMPRSIWALLAVVILIYTSITYYKKVNLNQIKLTHLLKSWNPVLTGLSLGVLGVIARYSSALAGRNFGLSTTDGIHEIYKAVFLFEQIGWIGVFILGLIIGSLISAVRGNEFKISIPSSHEFIRFYGGGIMLGTGAMLGYGCNFGHIFGGIPELGLSSVFALLFMLIGNRVGSYLFYIKYNQEIPTSSPISIRN
ncbi:MAG: hypothetical protein HeimC2_08060 [Candidatus Heimdallarchaeota archaeon LC_2]|nr:MAG: hypothetical protein HeimC2_08060 [Candidatus Heimdallarchaeota archaeon LC_2]